MKQYVLSIIVFVFIISILTLIIPSGKLKKSIKSIFALILTLVIIKPLFELKDNQINFDYVFNSEDFFVYTDYLDYVNDKKIEVYKQNCIKILENNGVYGAQLDIEYFADENNHLIIQNIFINLKNSVIKSDKEHIDIIEGIKTDIKSYLSVEKEQVVIYG